MRIRWRWWSAFVLCVCACSGGASSRQQTQPKAGASADPGAAGALSEGGHAGEGFEPSSGGRRWFVPRAGTRANQVAAPPPTAVKNAAGAPAAGGSEDGAAGAGGGPEEPPPLLWSGAVGDWCGPEAQRTLWLVANPEWAVCQQRAQLIQRGEALDGFSIELPAAALRATPVELEAAARYCGAGSCQRLPASLRIDEYRADVGALGSFRIALEDGVTLDGRFQASSCEWDDYLPSSPSAERQARGLRLQEVALFQAVKVSVMRRLEAITERTADVVAGRSALLRAYVVPGEGFSRRPVRARLTLVNESDAGEPQPPEILESTITVSGSSGDGALDSTFNFEIPAESLRETTRYSLELLEAEPCAEFPGEVLGARYPASGSVGLGARGVGGVRVQLVPVRALRDGVELLPDLSLAQLERFKRRLTQLFPITDAEITVRSEPVTSEATSMLDLLDQISALRASEVQARDLSYYGVVRFTEETSEYCAAGCLLGAGEVGTTEAPSGGSAVGIGYAGEEAAGTFAHELGHVYGRDHSPCGVPGDPAFPYSRGGIGSWGYDLFERRLIDPLSYKDFMGYCSPVWVSDYVFGHLLSFISGVNSLALESRLESEESYRSLILQPGHPPRWGLSRRVWGTPNGAREEAEVTDDVGHVVGSVPVYRAQVGDLGAEIVYVPEPRVAKWFSVRVFGHVAHPYAAPVTVPRLLHH